MRIIAITGRSGCGKSTVSGMYAQMGDTVLDGDKTAREVLDNDPDVLRELCTAFGPTICHEDGTPDRKAIAGAAFRTPETARQLTDITHPAIVRSLLACAQLAEQQGQSLVFVDGAVIIDAPFEQYCDEIILVCAPQSALMQRIMLRDNIDEDMARRRLAGQLSEQQMREKATYIIENNRDEAALRHCALDVLQRIKGG